MTGLHPFGTCQAPGCGKALLVDLSALAKAHAALRAAREALRG